MWLSGPAAAPRPVAQVFAPEHLDLLCRTANVEKIEAGPKGVVLTLRENTFPNPGALVELINDERGNAKLRPDHKLVFKRDWETPEERLTGTHRLMSTLAKLADQAKAA